MLICSGIELRTPQVPRFRAHSEKSSILKDPVRHTSHGFALIDTSPTLTTDADGLRERGPGPLPLTTRSRSSGGRFHRLRAVEHVASGRGPNGCRSSRSRRLRSRPQPRALPRAARAARLRVGKRDRGRARRARRLSGRIRDRAGSACDKRRRRDDTTVTASASTTSRSKHHHARSSTSACAGHAGKASRSRTIRRSTTTVRATTPASYTTPTASSSRSYTSRSTPLRVMHDHRAESSLIQLEVLSAGCRFRRSRSNRRRGRRRRA
jgi:hypothetical protein